MLPVSVLQGERFVYHEGWGERLNTRSAPVLCMLDIKSSSVSVLESVPEHVSPGQALWSPGDTGVVFVGWWHEPFRLGLSACSNRRSGIFHLELASGHCELLSAPNRASFSPRLSPDGQHLLYLEGAVGGPHRQCLQLRLLTWQMRQTVTVLDVVQEPTGSESCKAGCCWGIGPSHCVPPLQLPNALPRSQPSLESTPMRCRRSAGQLTAGGHCCAPHSGAARTYCWWIQRLPPSPTSLPGHPRGAGSC